MRSERSRRLVPSATVVLALWWVTALGAGNMIANGTFERGDRWPDYWHVRLTDFMPKRIDPGPPPTYHYICACGHDFGEVKPWCGLICPKCSGFISGEECGAWYVKNHERVSLVRGGVSGRCVKFTLPRSVGNNQGVRIMSYLVRAKRGWGYVLSFYVKARGAHPRVFVEGYRFQRSPKTTANWEGDKDPSAPSEPIERCFRAHVNCDSPRSWTKFTKDVVAPERYQFDFLLVKLYAYMPGEAWFDNVSLRPMTTSELRRWLAAKKRPKDSRFRYKRKID